MGVRLRSFRTRCVRGLSACSAHTVGTQHTTWGRGGRTPRHGYGDWRPKAKPLKRRFLHSLVPQRQFLSSIHLLAWWILMRHGHCLRNPVLIAYLLRRGVSRDGDTVVLKLICSQINLLLCVDNSKFNKFFSKIKHAVFERQWRGTYHTLRPILPINTGRVRVCQVWVWSGRPLLATAMLEKSRRYSWGGLRCGRWRRPETETWNGEGRNNQA